MQPEALLKKHNLRKTSGRLSVLQCFLECGKALAHGEVQELVGSEKLDRVTLYRILQSFEEKGLLHKVPDDQVSVKYALCDHTHNIDHTHSDNHAHFKCNSCGDTVCLEESSIPSINIPEGFQVNQSFLLFEGLCNQCVS
ncbi:MAG: Fur family transcriptional regulator [Owenweeksia sp.]